MNLRDSGQPWIPTGDNLDADAHRDDGKRSIVGADELLTAFLELEAVIPSRSFSF